VPIYISARWGACAVTLARWRELAATGNKFCTISTRAYKNQKKMFKNPKISESVFVRLVIFISTDEKYKTACYDAYDVLLS